MNLKQLKSDYVKGKISKSDYITLMHELHKSLFEYAEFMKDTDIKRIDIADGSVTFTSRAAGITLVCDKDDQRIAPIEILNFGFYEREEFAVTMRLIDEGFTVFDIGGNIGWYAINIVKSKKNVKVYTFEPIPKTYNYLKKNLEFNHIIDVEPYNFGFSNSEEDLPFYYYPEGSSNASMANVSNNSAAQKITCHVKKLDDFVLKENHTVDFIKCDVEGAELFVFQGGLLSIRKHKPIIFAELLRKWASKFNYHPNKVIQLLHSEGYQCYTITGDKLSTFQLMDENTVETNFFFLHTEKHKTQIKAITG